MSEEGEGNELNQFTGDGVSKLADTVSAKQAPRKGLLPLSRRQPADAKNGSHFKSVLRELEENVSSDEDDDNNADVDDAD